MNDYNKSISGTTTFIDNNPVNCNNADISVSGASTMIINDITCKGSLQANTSQSSTFKITGDAVCGDEANIVCGDNGIFGSTTFINSLKCKNGKITLSSSSTVIINNLECDGTLEIEMSGSSTLTILGGDLNIVKGDISGSSTGTCRASIKENDVQVSGSSTWTTN